MKKKSLSRVALWYVIMILFFSAIQLLPSCSTVKRDCQGTKHYRLKNGIYL